MRTLGAAVLLALLAACSAGNSSSQSTAGASSAPTMQSKTKANVIVLHPSTRTFKELDTACKGTLGGITFALNHTRNYAMPGVDVTEKPTTNGVSMITFTDKARHKAATVKANAHDHTVSGNGVITKLNGSVACVQ
jgi:hypothetical protein